MKSVFHILICLLLISISLSAQTALCATDTNETAPDFEFVTLSGEKVRSDNLKGKVIVLDFWNNRCNPCIKSMPQMEKFYQKYKNDKQVAIYFVNSGWDSLEKAKSFANKRRKHFLFFSWGEKYDLPFAYDSKSATIKKFKLDSNPLTIIIDTEFNIRVKHSRYIKDFYVFLNENIKPLLVAGCNTVNT